MAISFNSIPSNLKIPFVACEFDATNATQGPALLDYKALIIGQKTSSGTGTANTIVKVSNADAVATLAGRGSMLHTMAKAWFANNKFTECNIGILADNGAGVAATGTLTVTGPATAAGTISLYVGGVLVETAVANSATAAQIGPLLAAAINANHDLPVTAAAGTTPNEHVVTVTYRHKCAVGNDVDLRLNYADGQALPTGIGVAIVAMAHGTTNPTLTSLITAMGDTWYHIIVHPYTDSTSLTAIETELSSRFGPLRMIDGVAITSAVGSAATLEALGATRNSPHSCIVAQPGSSPLTSPCEFAAATAAVIAYYANIDPARPLQTLPVSNVLAPAESNYFTNSERNACLGSAIGTTKISASQVQLERIITTYQTSAAGSPDYAYYDITTPLTLLYLRYSWRAWILSRYPRHKLANDGTRFGAGQAVATPKLIKGEALSWFRSMENLGLVEGFDTFKENLIVERDTVNVNQINVLLPPDIINQLIVTATKIQFLL